MGKIKYSIITATYNRAHMVHRAIKSVQAQTYVGEFEHIIVDDCSQDNTDEVVGFYTGKSDVIVKYVKTPFHGDRTRARNLGMKEASGEWILWLDSDDLYVPQYLEMLDMAISAAPKAEIFNFGGIKVHRHYNSTLINVFTPELKGKGHESFRSGDIAAGHFIFKKKLLDEVGYLPEVNNCWLFAEEAKKEFPELRKMYEDQAELGNPWGDDYFMFYKLTRNHVSIPLDINLYIIWGREEKELKI